MHLFTTVPLQHFNILWVHFSTIFLFITFPSKLNITIILSVNIFFCLENLFNNFSLKNDDPLDVKIYKFIFIIQHMVKLFKSYVNSRIERYLKLIIIDEDQGLRPENYLLLTVLHFQPINIWSWCHFHTDIKKNISILLNTNYNSCKMESTIIGNSFLSYAIYQSYVSKK